MKLFTRKERKAITAQVALAKASSLAKMEAAALNTETLMTTSNTPPSSSDRPTPDDVALWFSNSVGTWKRGFRSADYDSDEDMTVAEFDSCFAEGIPVEVTNQAPRTGAERYLTERLLDAEYREAFLQAQRKLG